MTRTKTAIGFAAAIVAAACSLAGAAGLFNLNWRAIAAGGGASQASGFVLLGTAGQCAAGGLGGGKFALEGGFMTSPAPQTAARSPWWKY